MPKPPREPRKPRPPKAHKPTPREQLIAALEASGMTRQAVADASGVSRTTVSNYLAGKTDVLTETWERLMGAIQASL